MEKAAFGLGRELVESRRGWERNEAEWLQKLMEFERSGDWAADGHRSCASWLVWQTGMARSTVQEKLRIGWILERRPLLLEAFSGGRLSYSQMRLISTLDDPDADVEAAFIDVAASAHTTIADLERMVRLYRLHQEQHLPPPDPDLQRHLLVQRNVADGMAKLTVVLREPEMEEFLKALEAFDGALFRQARANTDPVDESAAAAAATGDTADDPANIDDPADQDDGDESEPVDESAAADQPSGALGHRTARRADAFMNLVASALTGTGNGARAAGDDRYLVHIVRVVGRTGTTYIDGEPVNEADADTIACDCSNVEHHITADGEPLHLGRKTREWSAAQRRAINIRDGGHCRYPGCDSRYVDIHHIQWWTHHGPTDIDNAMNCCRYHHSRIHHEGFQIDGDPNYQLRFARRDGTPIGATRPAIATRLRLPLAV